MYKRTSTKNVNLRKRRHWVCNLKLFAVIWDGVCSFSAYIQRPSGRVDLPTPEIPLFLIACAAFLTLITNLSFPTFYGLGKRYMLHTDRMLQRRHYWDMFTLATIRALRANVKWKRRPRQTLNNIQIYFLNKGRIQQNVSNARAPQFLTLLSQFL